MAPRPDVSAKGPILVSFNSFERVCSTTTIPTQATIKKKDDDDDDDDWETTSNSLPTLSGAENAGPYAGSVGMDDNDEEDEVYFTPDEDDLAQTVVKPNARTHPIVPKVCNLRLEETTRATVARSPDECELEARIKVRADQRLGRRPQQTTRGNEKKSSGRRAHHSANTFRGDAPCSDGIDRASASSTSGQTMDSSPSASSPGGGRSMGGAAGRVRIPRHEGDRFDDAGAGRHYAVRRQGRDVENLLCPATTSPIEDETSVANRTASLLVHHGSRISKTDTGGSADRTASLLAHRGSKSSTSANSNFSVQSIPLELIQCKSMDLTNSSGTSLMDATLSRYSSDRDSVYSKSTSEFSFASEETPSKIGKGPPVHAKGSGRKKSVCWQDGDSDADESSSSVEKFSPLPMGRRHFPLKGGILKRTSNVLHMPGRFPSDWSLGSASSSGCSSNAVRRALVAQTFANMSLIDRFDRVGPVKLPMAGEHAAMRYWTSDSDASDAEEAKERWKERESWPEAGSPSLPYQCVNSNSPVIGYTDVDHEALSRQLSLLSTKDRADQVPLRSSRIRESRQHHGISNLRERYRSSSPKAAVPRESRQSPPPQEARLDSKTSYTSIIDAYAEPRSSAKSYSHTGISLQPSFKLSFVTAKEHNPSATPSPRSSNGQAGKTATTATTTSRVNFSRPISWSASHGGLVNTGAPRVRMANLKPSKPVPRYAPTAVQEPTMQTLSITRAANIGAPRFRAADLTPKRPVPQRIRTVDLVPARPIPRRVTIATQPERIPTPDPRHLSLSPEPPFDAPLFGTAHKAWMRKREALLATDGGRFRPGTAQSRYARYSSKAEVLPTIPETSQFRAGTPTRQAWKREIQDLWRLERTNARVSRRPGRVVTSPCSSCTPASMGRVPSVAATSCRSQKHVVGRRTRKIIRVLRKILRALFKHRSRHPLIKHPRSLSRGLSPDVRVSQEDVYEVWRVGFRERCGRKENVRRNPPMPLEYQEERFYAKLGKC